MSNLEELKKSKNKKIILLGSGALTIGQAGEFDYSGSQALIALEEEGFEVIVVNPNIATVQTNKKENRKIYLYPVDSEHVERIIEQEKPVAIIGGFGGQTALNCLVNLEKNGVLKKHHVINLGTPVETLISTEDRKIFSDKMSEFGLSCLKFKSFSEIDKISKDLNQFQFPVIVRSAFALGGLGSGFANNASQLLKLAEDALAINPQVMIEKSLQGWKEIEYEVLRDSFGNTICICNMENLDPLGIHTGDSIVVAPSQTINDQEYQLLRDVAIKIVNQFGIIGECNVQFALNPDSLEYFVIEINARLSRSSALASKATGFPIAYIAAKVVLGYSLLDLKNPLTTTTSAFFEPALDYITVKIPKWNLDKFSGARRQLDSKMKSVGEVMAIGKTFVEAFQKAIRMVTEKSEGISLSLLSHLPDQEIREGLKNATDQRIFILFEALRRGFQIEELFQLTKITPWFLHQIDEILKTEKLIRENSFDLEKLTRDEFLYWKKTGFSDSQIASILNSANPHLKITEMDLNLHRHKLDIHPWIKKIDTVAAEFPATSNYLYLTYHGISHDISSSQLENRDRFLILGSGPYRIGSSVEFDWCGVSASEALRKAKKGSLVLNCNPETVSTDYNTSDRLYFDEISVETITFINEFEVPTALISCFGGQQPNNLTSHLKAYGLKLAGHSYDSINNSEDRPSFSAILDRLDIEQPRWTAAKTTKDISDFIAQVGFPVLVRPSFVLSGTAMSVCTDLDSLNTFITFAKEINPEGSIIVSEFITDSMEFECDGVAKNGKLLLAEISRHVEKAGVHSGDATLIYPVEDVYSQTAKKLKTIAEEIADALRLNGPFNIQFIVNKDRIHVIECNARASRSFPFISKVSGFNLTEFALTIMTDESIPPLTNFKKLPPVVGVKAAMFSFNRLEGVDPILGVEMLSTGEVGCVGTYYPEVYIRALAATGIKKPKKGLLFSSGPKLQKAKFIEVIKALKNLNVPIFATEGSADHLLEHGVECFKMTQKEINGEFLLNLFQQKKIDMVINIPKNKQEIEKFNNRKIRELASSTQCSLLTDTEKSVEFFKCLYLLSQNSAEQNSLHRL